MKVIGRDEVEAAVAAGILRPDQTEPLLAFLQSRHESGRAPRFDFSHLLWYVGALIVIGAMGLFSTLAFQQMGGRALTATALIYASCFTVAGHVLWHRRGLRVPAGLLVAVAVSMAPLAIYGMQAEFGLWPQPFGDPGTYGSFYDWINGSWLYMDLGTILAGCLALRFYPFSFIVAIIAVALWFLSMDLTPWVFHDTNFSWEMRCKVSLWFGLVLILIAWIVDLRKWAAGDFAFWLHLSGLAAFWGGLSLLDSNSEIDKVIYCLINVLLVLLAVFLMRRAYAVFGAMGVAGYLAHLAEDVFADSLVFPLVLSLIGIGVIAVGILYFRRRRRIIAWLRTTLPEPVQRLRPVHARGAA